MKNKFSIIVPVYNVEEYLNKCFDSILNQNYSNYEVIIVCDKCTDKSENIVDEYVSKYSHFKKIYEEHTGLSKARNIGIEYVTGDYILFLDSDDYINFDLLEVLNNSLLDFPDVVRFQANVINGKEVIKYNEEGFSNLVGTEAFKKICKYHFIENAWCYAYKTSFWKDYNFKYTENCIAEDYGLTPYILALSTSVKSLSYVGYNYVIRENSLMNNNNYDKKIKKMNDLLLQSDNIKNNIKDLDNTSSIISFLNNSMIYYITTLKKEDYKYYKKILKEKKCFDHIKIFKLVSKNPIKNVYNIFRNILIKVDPYFFYNKVVK